MRLNPTRVLMIKRLIACVLASFAYLACGNGQTAEVLSKQVDGLNLKADCRWITAGTVAPYVAVSRGDNPVLIAMVHPGFDLMSDCTKGSVVDLDFVRSSYELIIRFHNGREKRIKILSNER